MAKLAGALFVLLVTTMAPLPSVAYHGECHPEPIGRCGAFQRETVGFCYIRENGAYLKPTEEHATPIDVYGPLDDDADDDADYYVWNGRVEDRLADLPTLGPTPHAVLWEEDNSVAGLQVRPFTCASWIWFAEEGLQWVGPFNVILRQADQVLL